MNTSRTTVTIANGASQSSEIDASGSDILGIEMPAAWTAAAITVLAASREDSPASGGAATFNPIHDDAGVELSFTVAAGRFVALRPDIAPLTRGPWRLKLRSGTAGVPVNQAAERTIVVVLGTVN